MKHVYKIIHKNYINTNRGSSVGMAINYARTFNDAIKESLEMMHEERVSKLIAKAYWDFYTTLKDVGFTHDEAMKITVNYKPGK